MGQTELCVIFTKTAWCTTLHGENAVHFLCTPKNEGKRVHVPPDEKTCGHAVIRGVLWMEWPYERCPLDGVAL